MVIGRTVRPIASIKFGDYEDDLYVYLVNDGVGPLLIDEFICKNRERKGKNIIDFMPKDITWRTFIENLNGWTVPPNGRHYLIRLSRNPEDENFDDIRHSVRKALSELSVQVIYHDLYDKKFESQVRDLAWFGRTIKAAEKS